MDKYTSGCSFITYPIGTSKSVSFTIWARWGCNSANTNDVRLYLGENSK